jgi:SAM-dependent methyltransferase
MRPVFDEYAHYYDQLYKDKDYAAETEYVVGHIRKQAPGANYILEMGCGTGSHATHLAQEGFTIHGVDLSETMIGRAEERRAMLPLALSQRMTFAPGDIRTVRTGDKYDVAVSLFHVMSYQATNEDLETTFETAAVHLNPGGLFLFDFWYGPAVLTQRPEVRVKRLEDEYVRVTRIAEPVMHVNENIVDVNYTVFIQVKLTGAVTQLRETHRMRYLFLPEIEKIMHGCDFDPVISRAWMTNSPLSSEHWAGFVLATKK